MAIKVSGTTVIDDSRQLSNIASVDATTVAALGSAGVGGGGGSFDATADGAITAGDPVGITSANTVKTISSPKGAATQYDSGANSQYNVTVYDPVSQKVVMIYNDGQDSNRLKAVVGTPSGTSISFGTPVSIANNYPYANSYNVHAAVVKESTGDIVAIWRDVSNNVGYSVVIRVSGTSVTYGPVRTISNSFTWALKIAYDSVQNVVVVGFRESSGGETSFVAGTVSNQDISWGNVSVFNSGVNELYYSLVYDTNINKVIAVYRNEFDKLRSVVLTLSGTSISYGQEADLSTPSSASPMTAVFDPSTNKTVAYYLDGLDGSVKAVVISVSGTTITYGTPVEAFSSYYAIENGGSVYNPDTQKVYLTLGSTSVSHTILVEGSVSGTSFVRDNFFTLDSDSSPIVSQNITYDENVDKLVVIQKRNNGQNNEAIVTDPVQLTNFANWVGFASENISSGATGTINTIGATDENQTGLSAGKPYYLQDDASITTDVVTDRFVGRALSSTKLLVLGNKVLL